MHRKRFIDIGANLTDGMYRGIYHGSKKHNPDLDSVLNRCWNGGLEKVIITGGNLDDCKSALELANSNVTKKNYVILMSPTCCSPLGSLPKDLEFQKLNSNLTYCLCDQVFTVSGGQQVCDVKMMSFFLVTEKLYSTVGCHPTRCNDFQLNPSEYLKNLEDLIISGQKKVVAIGECGLDYERLQFCQKDTQKKYFDYQLQLCEKFDLPLFLHCRAAWNDFFEILSINSSKLKGGVIHSFDGSLDDMKRIVQMGFYIGINGCSLKTEENLKVASQIPKDRLLIETDCPWCEIRPTHAGAKYIKTIYPSVKKEKFVNECMVKGRNEPANITQILEVLVGIRGEQESELCENIFCNTINLFFSKSENQLSV